MNRNAENEQVIGGASATCTPSLLFTLEADGRHWADVDICGLVEALNSVMISRSTGILLDAIAPSAWSERVAQLAEASASKVVSNLRDLPEKVSSDVITVMSSSPLTGSVRMDVIETVCPGGADQLARELTAKLGVDLSLTAAKTQDSADEAFEHSQKRRKIVDGIFDAVLIFTGICSCLAAMAHYLSPGIMFVLAGIMRGSFIKSVSAPFITMPEGKLLVSYILSAFETEELRRSNPENKVDLAKYVYIMSRREPGLALIMISFLGMSLLLFVAAAPAVFQVLMWGQGQASADGTTSFVW